LIFGHLGEGRVGDPDEEFGRRETVGEGEHDGGGFDGISTVKMEEREREGEGERRGQRGARIERRREKRERAQEERKGRFERILRQQLQGQS